MILCNSAHEITSSHPHSCVVIYGLEPEDGIVPPSQEEIEAAAMQANAHGFISSFPEGYETGEAQLGV